LWQLSKILCEECDLNLQQSLTDYFNLQKKIFDYFGYVEDWVSISLADKTNVYWFLTGVGENSSYVYRYKPFTLESVEDVDVYSGEVYTQRFLPKWVYRGEEYTMVCADTHVDGNKYLMIFDNTKECKDPVLIDTYCEV